MRVLAAGCAVLLFALNIFFQAEVSYDGAEIVTITRYGYQGIVMLATALFFLALFFRIQKLILRINQFALFFVLSLIYTSMAVYLIHYSCNVIRADAMSVHISALLTKSGDFSSFYPGGYLHTYPHQIGLMLYDMLLSFISENPSFNFFVNFLLVLGINFLSWSISKLLWQDARVHLLTMLLSFLFLPQLFFIMFAYGQIPSLFFLLIGFYYTIRWCKEFRFGYLFVLILSVVISASLRMNSLIGAIAILIYLFLHLLQHKQLKFLLTAMLLIICMVLTPQMIHMPFEHAADTSLNEGCPSILWLAMGTDIDNRVRSAGWYDNSSYSIYIESATHDDAAAAGWEKMQNNIDKIIFRPTEALEFFQDKIISQWCEPLYQSVWSGPMLTPTQTTNTSPLQSLYSGGTVEDYLETFCKALSILLWCGYTIYLLQNKHDTDWELAALYFIGGLIFHIFWEGKSQYIYPYVFCLIPFAAHGLTLLGDISSHNRHSRQHQ